MVNYKQDTQLFPFRFPGIPCDIFGCYTRAAWVIGRPDGPLTDCFKICPGCVQTMLDKLPQEFQPVNEEEAEKEVEVLNNVAHLINERAEQSGSSDSVIVTDALEHLSQFTKEKLNELGARELKKLASRHNVVGYSNMKKDELVEAIHDKIGKVND